MWLLNGAIPRVYRNTNCKSCARRSCSCRPRGMVPLCRKAYASERGRTNVSTEDSLLPGFQRAMHIHPTVSEFIPTMMDQLKPLQ